MNWESLGHLLEDAARKFGEKTLFIFENERVSFAGANRQANKTANALHSLGIAKGDRVALMLPNIAAFPITWFALAKLGAVLVPVNVNYKDHDLTYTLTDSESRFFIIYEPYLDQWGQVCEKTPSVEKTLVLTESGSKSDWTRMVEAASEEFEISNVSKEDLLNIQYTSGTTGFPKGCMLTHKYWMRLAQDVADYLMLTSNDCDMTVQPFYYMDPQWNAAMCLIGGSALVIMSRFSPSRFWGQVIEHHVTVLYMLGSMPFFLMKMPEDPALDRGHHMRVILCSGIHPNFHAEFERRWNVPWREVFGMTESGADLMVSLDDVETVGSGTMGKPVSKQVRIVDSEDNDVADGEMGEMILRGEPMMLGYWRKPEATAETIRDGWLHTGDLVVRDSNGYYYWRARIKDTIRRSNENIASVEVESILAEHSAIKLAAVVPVPDELRGEEVKAYIILKDGHTPQNTPPEMILEHARKRLAYFKVPRYIEYVDDLPRTPSERVEKHKLVKMKPDLRVGSYDAVDHVWR